MPTTYDYEPDYGSRDAMTRQTTPGDTAERRIRAFCGAGQYGPYCYLDAGGRPRIGACEHGLVVLGVATVAEAVAVAGAVMPEQGPPGGGGWRPLPPAQELVAILRESLDTVERASAACPIDYRTAPTPRHVEARDATARARLVRAEEALAEAPPAAHRSIRQARAAEVRDAKRNLARREHPLWHALDIVAGASCITTVDLRLVRRALHGMGVRSGVLYAVAPTRACVLVTRRGIALVLPLRV